MRGRKPKPTALRRLQGNPGKRPLNAAEPAPAAGARPPNCPRHLDRAARREWRRLARRLHRLGLFTEIDRAALAAHCQAWSRWIAAEELIAADGLTVTTGKGNVIQHPAVGIANKAMEVMLKFAVEFGLTPSSRSRIHAAPPAQADPFEAWAGRRKKRTA